MARLLSCPHCRAQFSFDDWARATSCPACARRLSFFEASSQAVPAAAAGVASPVVASPVVAPPPASSTAFTPAVAPTSQAAVAPAAPLAPPSVAPVAAAEPPWGEQWTWSATESEAGDAAAASANADPLSAAAAPTIAAPPTILAAPLGADPLSTVAAPTTLQPADAARPAAVFAGDTPRRHAYTVGGKALEWSSAWTVIVVVWVLVAVGLVATRVEMGSLTVMTPAEISAIAAVREIKLPTGASTEAVLRYAATHDLTLEGHVAKIPTGGTQMWYAFDRPWEHRIYVYSQLPGASMVGKSAVLSWTVSNGVAKPDGATKSALTKTAQTMAHPPSSKSVPAIPGIIPSIPPSLQ